MPFNQNVTDQTLFMGAGGVNPTQNAATQVALSRLAMDQKSRAIQDQYNASLVRQQQQQEAFNQALSDEMKAAQSPDYLSGGQVAAQGGSQATDLPTDQTTGRPTLRTPDQPGDQPDGGTASAATPPPQQPVPLSQSATPQATPSPGLTTNAGVNTPGVFPNWANSPFGAAAQQDQPGPSGAPQISTSVVLPGSGGLPDYQLPPGQLYDQPAAPAPNGQSGAVPENSDVILQDDQLSENGEIADLDRTQPPNASLSAQPGAKPVPVSGPPATAAPPPAAPSGPAPVTPPAAAPVRPQPLAAPPQPQSTLNSDYLARLTKARNNMLLKGAPPTLVQGWYGGAVKAYTNELDANLKMVQTNAAQFKATMERLKRLDDNLMAFQQLPDAIRQTEWPRLIRSQQDAGLATPQDIAEWNLTQYPGDDRMPMIHMALRGAIDSQELALKKSQQAAADALTTSRNSPEAAAKRASDARKAQLEANEKEAEDAGVALSRSTTPQQYVATLRSLSLSPQVRARMPDTSELDWTPGNLPATQEKILTSAMTADHLAAYNLRKQAEADRATNERLNRQFREETITLQRAAAEDRREARNSVSQAAIRQANSQVERLQNRERTLIAERNAVLHQISEAELGHPFQEVSKTGNPYGAAMDPNLGPGRQSLSALRSHADELGEQITSVINDKHDVMDGVGATPRLNRADEIANLHRRGDQQITESKPATPAPQNTTSPPTNVTPKPQAKAQKQPVTMDYIRNYVQQKRAQGNPNYSETDAIREFQSYGYPIAK
jgi:hypothetical protein